MTVFVSDEQADATVEPQRLQRLAEFVLSDQGIPDAMELTVLCVDRDAMTELNAEHMGSEGPTDVLAFPLDEPAGPRATVPGDEGEQAGLLGDVVLCPEIATAQAQDLGRTPRAEMDLLVVHGILHILGHDHADDEEKAIMFSLTDRLLADFARTGEAASR